jgi:hypothetical protein
VYITRLLVRDSIEEKMVRLQQRKTAIVSGARPFDSVTFSEWFFRTTGQCRPRRLWQHGCRTLRRHLRKLEESRTCWLPLVHLSFEKFRPRKSYIYFSDVLGASSPLISPT